MVTAEQMKKRKEAAVPDLKKENLVDIRSVHIDQSLPEKKRMLDYLAQIKNPYCFRCGETEVKLSFSSTVSLHRLLVNFLIRHKRME